jgi:hypothetical protein
MAPEAHSPGSVDAAMLVVLTLLFMTAVTVMVLTEHFRDLPGALVAFASARYILRL